MFEHLDFSLSASPDLAQSCLPSHLPYLPTAMDCRSCGLCVGHCPTYQLTGVGEETPRQRVRTLEKLLAGLPLRAEEQQHLENCLQCRACEPVCPSRMHYSQAFDAAQVILQTRRQRSWLVELAFALIEHKRWRRLLMPVLSLYQFTGVQTGVRASGLLQKLNLDHAERLLCPPALSRLPVFNPVKRRKSRGRVALFTGCLAEHFDRHSQLAAIKMLNAIGYEVVVAEGQVCCGALHRHHGRSAQHLIEQNLQTFYALEVDAVLHLATGCGAMLADYPRTSDERGDWLHRYLQDIHQFLLDHWPPQLQLADSRLRVAVHEPCSQRNVLKNQQAVYELLAKIPSLDIVGLADNALCCGAGGSYLLSHPQTAERLRQRKRASIASHQVDLVVSSNFACSLHLNQGGDDQQPPVLHPLQLLADRL